MKKNIILKLFFLNSIFLTFILIFGELFARSLFPEFKGDFYSENITRSINFHRGIFSGVKLIRVPSDEFSLDTNATMFAIVGGSVTGGFGMVYEDIFWVKFKNLNNLIREEKIEVIPFAAFGDSLNNQNRNEEIRKVAKEFKNNKKYIAYQFSFSDIAPNEDKLFQNDDTKNIISVFDTYLRKLAGRHLHKSVLIRVSRHYAGIIKRKSYNNKSCKEKGSLSLLHWSYAFGAIGLEKEANESWKIFEKNISKLKSLSNEINSELVIIISPTIFDIDLNKVHPHFNTNSLDFSCSTIDPREKLSMISQKYNIKLLDPEKYMRNKFELNLKEGNFVRFFYAGDSAHITPTASTHLSNYIFSKMFFDKKNDLEY